MHNKHFYTMYTTLVRELHADQTEATLNENLATMNDIVSMGGQPSPETVARCKSSVLTMCKNTTNMVRLCNSLLFSLKCPMERRLMINLRNQLRRIKKKTHALKKHALFKK